MSLRVMAKRTDAGVVARTLNRLTDSAFIEALSASDSATMADLIEDYFCNDRDSGIFFNRLQS